MDASKKEDGTAEKEGDVAMDPSGDAAPKKTESKNLDLAFAMDCTGSMSSYIYQAQQNIRLIVEEIVSKEKADVCLALVEYRDHPPQDHTFVTRVNDFTSSVRSMKRWLDQCSANGGGDTPEAVADALHQVAKLSWRGDSTKICVFIADAPPHGLSSSGDHFPKGCPDGLDPMVVTRQLAEKGVTLYIAGCEPSISPYKDFFMALAHLTGGQYVPLAKADVLAKVIVGGAQEELSLQQLMEEVNQEVMHAAEEADKDIDAEELTRRVHMKLKSKGAVVKQLQMNECSLAAPSVYSKKLASASTMMEVKSDYTVAAAPCLTEAPRLRAAPVPRATPSLPSQKMKMKKKAAPDRFSFFGFGRKKKEVDDSTCSDDGEVQEEEEVGEYLAEPMAPEEMMSESIYQVVQEEVNLAQASRMVQKSIATNHLQSKMKK